MENLQEKAAQYVAENLKEILSDAFARVYEDGYRDGYYDRKDQEPQAVGDEVNFVDLGLPSKTLWSEDYLMEKGETVFMPYLDAEKFNIPTEEQFEELRKYCRFKYALDSNNQVDHYEFIGPSENVLKFYPTGRFEGEQSIHEVGAYAWLKGDVSHGETQAIAIDPTFPKNNRLFIGYKIAVRLVEKKYNDC